MKFGHASRSNDASASADFPGFRLVRPCKDVLLTSSLGSLSPQSSFRFDADRVAAPMFCIDARVSFFLPRGLIIPSDIINHLLPIELNVRMSLGFPSKTTGEIR